MRSRRYKGIEGEGSSYDLSISDLMAALCCVFVIFTIGVTTSLKEKNMAANQYNETKVYIYNEINDAMKDTFKECNATFERETLTLKFSAADAFKDDDSTLKEKFKTNLSKIFPKLIYLLYKSPKRGDIEEIRIEGFTASDSRLGKNEQGDDDYIAGIKLSQDRSKNVLIYCLGTNYLKDIPADEQDEYREWVRTHISASGYSFSRAYWTYDSDGEIKRNDYGVKEMDKAKTRRVEFRIRTNADKVIEKYTTINVEDLLDEGA